MSSDSRDALRDRIRNAVERELRDLVNSAGTPTTAASVSSPAENTLREVIAVGADHGGFQLKQAVATHLQQRGFEIVDCGTHSEESCDYPVFARRVAESVASGAAALGIVVDGAGIGSCMVANKVSGIRAAHCDSLFGARNAREHNHANVLTLGAGPTGTALALQVVDRFLATPCGGGRHARRVGMFEQPSIGSDPSCSSAP